MALTLYGPDGKQIGSMDSPNGTSGLEQISTIAEAPGTYRLEVASGDKNAPAGRYRVTVEPIRAPGDEDRARISAERMFFQAVQLEVQGSADSLRMAIQKYLASLPLWRTVGDHYEEQEFPQNFGALVAKYRPMFGMGGASATPTMPLFFFRSTQIGRASCRERV